MSQIINSLTGFQNYFEGLLERTDNDAEDIMKQTYMICSLVIRFKDKNSDIIVREQDGKSENMLSFWINREKYSLKFGHSCISVEMNKGMSQDQVISIFDKNAAFKDIYTTFKKVSGKSF